MNELPMRSVRRGRTARAAVACLLLAGPLVSRAGESPAAMRTVDVAPTQNLQTVFDQAQPGDTIRLHAGVYEGAFSLNRSGTAAQPIRITAFGDGAAVIAPKPGQLRVAPPDYHGGAPQFDRTLNLLDHAGRPVANVVLEGLELHGGVYVGRHGFTDAWNKLAETVKAGHDIPRYGDLVAAFDAYFCSNAIPYEQRAALLGIAASNITIRGCDFTGRGPMLWHVADSLIESNTVHALEANICGIQLQSSCFRNTVRRNDVADMHAPKAHWQGEGIRVVNFSSCNRIAENYIHHGRGAGFGIGLDVFADENTFASNRVEDIETIAYTDQANNSGNRWIGNTATGCAMGFDFASFWWNDDPAQSKSRIIYVERNRAVACHFADAAVGNVRCLRFVDNDFHSLSVSPRFQAWWLASGSTWNGAATLPDFASTNRASRFVKLF